MAVVELSLEETERALAGYEDRVALAASNSRTSTVLSGETAAVEEIVSRLEARDVFARWVKTDVAFHSPQMDELQAELRSELQGLEPHPTSLPFYSSVLGGRLDGLVLDGSYWASNLRQPVLFAAALEAALADGHDVFVEMSPHPILLGAVRQSFHHTGQEGLAVPSLRREEGERAVLLGSLGALHTAGVPVNWGRLHVGGPRCVSLPLFPWQRERFWRDDAPSNPRAVAGDGAGRVREPGSGANVDLVKSLGADRVNRLHEGRFYVQGRHLRSDI